MLRFTVPRDIYYGENAIDHLKDVKGKKAILVFGSERLIKDGTIPKIEGLLKEANIETELFYGVEADPGINTVKRGAEAMKKFQPDVIVAIGGGSPIDAAKAM
ncbi:iron-containing alcohol dehydrogenase, partial [Alkalibaculum bacchi]|uniref:iron-containing alcohol dehydrogenase n=1 Tax=Alkalibaculum bacchi TaxID=645887 RepID=UPI0026F369C3